MIIAELFRLVIASTDILESKIYACQAFFFFSSFLSSPQTRFQQSDLEVSNNGQNTLAKDYYQPHKFQIFFFGKWSKRQKFKIK